MVNSSAGRIKVVSTIVTDTVVCGAKIVAECLILWSYVYASRNLSSPIAHEGVNCFLNKQICSISSLPCLKMCVLKLIYYAVSKF